MPSGPRGGGCSRTESTFRVTILRSDGELFLQKSVAAAVSSTVKLTSRTLFTPHVTYIRQDKSREAFVKSTESDRVIPRPQPHLNPHLVFDENVFSYFEAVRKTFSCFSFP
jgi:hypothetical protein